MIKRKVFIIALAALFVFLIGIGNSAAYYNNLINLGGYSGFFGGYSGGYNPLFGLNFGGLSAFGNLGGLGSFTPLYSNLYNPGLAFNMGRSGGLGTSGGFGILTGGYSGGYNPLFGLNLGGLSAFGNLGGLGSFMPLYSNLYNPGLAFNMGSLGGLGTSGGFGILTGGYSGGYNPLFGLNLGGLSTFGNLGLGGINFLGGYGVQRYGCTDPSAVNYDPYATINNGSCQYVISGCTDPNATNYNANAILDDGSCQYSATFAPPTSQEILLQQLINEYRIANGKSAIPLSKSLTFVAKTHAKDLDNNPPQDPCNLHSWSNKGIWSSCCYTEDHSKASCMWDKPSELTNYTGNGYEIAYMHSWGATPENALAGWKGSPGHNNVILNLESWVNISWKSMGVGIYDNYAVVWFGKEVDPDGYW